MPERWKPIGETPYEVSDDGRVRNAATGHVLAERRHSNGYVRVQLGQGADRYVHRLVCEAFNGPCPLGWQCDHINHQRDDNRAANLRWLPAEDNRARRHFAQGLRNGQAKLNESEVRQIRAGPFYRGRDAVLARQFGVSRETVRDVRLGKYWSKI